MLFRSDLYGELEQNENLVFSPYSISSAFSMLYAGAAGDTEQEIADVLHFSPDQERFHTMQNTLDLTLHQRDRKSVV